MDLGSGRTFIITNDWYWRITENTSTLTLEEAVRDFARPFVALLDRAAEVFVVDTRLVIAFAGEPTHITLATNVTDRVAISGLIAGLNRILESARFEQAFAIMIPRRYELCGALLGADELDQLRGDPRLLVPSLRKLRNAQ